MWCEEGHIVYFTMEYAGIATAEIPAELGVLQALRALVLTANLYTGSTRCASLPTLLPALVYRVL